MIKILKEKKKPTVEEFFVNTEYTRWIYWPQPGVEKLVVWQAARMTPADYEKQHVNNPLEPDQREPYLEVAKPQDFLEALGGLLVQMGNSDWANQPNDSPLCGLYAKALSTLFVSDGLKQFRDWWYTGVPMDDQMEDYLLPTIFTELWIPLESATTTLTLLYEYFNSDPKTIWSKVGIFSYEIYAAKKSDLWLSMSSDMNCFRLDIFWFARSKGTFDLQPTKFYTQFWDLLYKKNIPFRPHWGKYLDERRLGVSHRRQVYPMMEAFLTVRSLLDPDNLFLTAYWRRVMGVN